MLTFSQHQEAACFHQKVHRSYVVLQYARRRCQCLMPVVSPHEGHRASQLLHVAMASTVHASKHCSEEALLTNTPAMDALHARFAESEKSYGNAIAGAACAEMH